MSVSVSVSVSVHVRLPVCVCPCLGLHACVHEVCWDDANNDAVCMLVSRGVVSIPWQVFSVAVTITGRHISARWCVRQTTLLRLCSACALAVHSARLTSNDKQSILMRWLTRVLCSARYGRC